MLTILLVYHRNLQKFSNSLAVCPTFHLSSTFIVSRFQNLFQRKSQKCILSTLQKNRITVPEGNQNILLTYTQHTYTISQMTNILYTKQNKYSITHILKSFKTPYCNMCVYFFTSSCSKSEKGGDATFFCGTCSTQSTIFFV